MNGPTVNLPLETAKRLRDVLAVAASHIPPLGEWANLLNEAIGLVESGAVPDVEALLYEATEGVALASGRHFHPTADRHGVDASLAVLADMAPALGANATTADLLPMLREAVKVQGPTCTLILVERANATTGVTKVVETIHDYPCVRVPLAREMVTLGPGRWGRVIDVNHAGRAVEVIVQLLGVAEDF